MTCIWSLNLSLSLINFSLALNLSEIIDCFSKMGTRKEGTERRRVQYQRLSQDDSGFVDEQFKVSFIFIEHCFDMQLLNDSRKMVIYFVSTSTLCIPIYKFFIVFFDSIYNLCSFFFYLFQSPPATVPWKSVAMAIVLFICGSVLLIIGSLLVSGHIDEVGSYMHLYF